MYSHPPTCMLKHFLMRTDTHKQAQLTLKDIPIHKNTHTQQHTQTRNVTIQMPLLISKENRNEIFVSCVFKMIFFGLVHKAPFSAVILLNLSLSRHTANTPFAQPAAPIVLSNKGDQRKILDGTSLKAHDKSNLQIRDFHVWNITVQQSYSTVIGLLYTIGFWPCMFCCTHPHSFLKSLQVCTHWQTARDRAFHNSSRCGQS